MKASLASLYIGTLHKNSFGKINQHIDVPFLGQVLFLWSSQTERINDS